MKTILKESTYEINKHMYSEIKVFFGKKKGDYTGRSTIALGDEIADR